MSELTTVLEDLAAGRIDATEAARRIDAINADPAHGDPAPSPGSPAAASTSHENGRAQYAQYHTESFGGTVGDVAGQPEPTEPDVEAPADLDEPAPTPSVPPPPRGSVNGLERVSVRAVGRRVRLVGDPKVSTVTVDGAHVLRRNGTVMEITSDGDVGPSLDGFSMLRPPRSLDDFRSLGLGKELLIRVNPKLVVDVEVTAGSLRSAKVPYLGKIRVTAGSAKATELAEVNDALVQAGQGTFEGTIATGRSRIRCESGNLLIRLGDASNVTVKAESQLGRVSWAGGHSGSGDEVVMGHGNARLDVGVVMGHAQVKVGTETADADSPAS